jgi:hypothetical protein
MPILAESIYNPDSSTIIFINEVTSVIDEPVIDLGDEEIL